MLMNILAVVAIAYLGVFGLLAIIWPAKVRDFYVRQYSRGLGDLSKYPGLSRLTQYNPRASMFRIFGALSLCSSLLLAYEWLKG
jgi:hypothetical protein